MDKVDSMQEQMDNVNTVRTIKVRTPKEMLVIEIEAKEMKATSGKDMDKNL